MSTKLPDKTCPFCDQEQSFRYIIETDVMRAIYPKSPACSYHALIIPKRHIAHVDMLKPQEFLEFQQLLGMLVTAAKEQIGKDFMGFQLLSNNGDKEVNQHVMHAHIHVFLRSKKDNRNPMDRTEDGATPHLTEMDIKNMKDLQAWFIRGDEV